MTDWIDISTPLRDGMAVWPGDTPFRLARMVEIEKGEIYNLTSISMSSHAGTHVDAPRNFFADGASIDEVPLEALVGPARVIVAQGRIGLEELESFRIQPGERILIKTGGRPTGIAPEAARRLAELGVRAVGIDLLSVGDPEIAEVHRILLGAGVWIIEVLDLSAVEPGDYELICLPLRVVGAEGAPARAILRKPNP